MKKLSSGQLFLLTSFFLLSVSGALYPEIQGSVLSERHYLEFILLAGLHMQYQSPDDQVLSSSVGQYNPYSCLRDR